MGQILDKPKGKQWRQKQIEKICDEVFENVKNENGRANLTFEDLYIIVLLVFNDLNKHLPGSHFDPPTKDKVKALMQDCDMNMDGELNREEFGEFIAKLTAETCIVFSRGLIINFAVAPVIAILTKKSTEGFPHVGKVVVKYCYADSHFSVCITCDPCIHDVPKINW